MSRKNIYLALAIIGTLAPGLAGAPYLLEHGYNPAHLMPAIFSTPVSAMVGINVIIGWITLAILMHTEGRELGIKTWLPIVGIFSGLPLYLYLREKINKGALPRDRVHS
jgi:membrane associated rhomboid family serine protease